MLESRMGVAMANWCWGTLVLKGPSLDSQETLGLKQLMRWAFKELHEIETKEDIND